MQKEPQDLVASFKSDDELHASMPAQFQQAQEESKEEECKAHQAIDCGPSGFTQFFAQVSELLHVMKNTKRFVIV